MMMTINTTMQTPTAISAVSRPAQFTKRRNSRCL